jgi:hypothetical protein
MPRAERPLDDDQTELGSFAAGLRRLRDGAGKPSYRELASRAHYSAASLSDAAGGKKLPSLALALAYVKACGGDEQEWEQRWRDIAAPPDPTGEAPYVGLKAFQQDDADRFFGREKLTAKLVDLVERHPLVGVFGASGSGKSSLLRAGLLPRLNNALLFTPGVHPLDECAVRLARLTGESAVALRAELGDPAAFGLRVKQHDEDLVLVIDQFEELFTLCGSEQRDWFVQALVSAPHVVIGVRADFYGHIGRHPELVEAVEGAQLLVGPMTTDELRRAITEPARHVGATVETALVTRMVADVAGQAAALPLVQHALVETWHRRRGMTLSLVGYEEAGGIEHAIARTAEAVFSELTPEQKQTARGIFLRLIALGEGTEDTKRRAVREDLDADVLEHLATARLVTLTERHAELTHEALIRSWPRLRDWIAEDRNALRVHHQLTEAAAGWGGDRDLLYKGARLAQAGELSPDSLTEPERAFLTASQADDRRRARRARAMVTALSVLVVLLVATVVFAVRKADEATHQRDEAVALKAAGEAVGLTSSDPQLAVKVALAAHRISSAQQAVDGLLNAYVVTSGLQSTRESRPALTFEQVSPDGKVALSTVDDNFMVWTLSADKATPHGLLPRGRQALMSGDGGVLVQLLAGNMEVWSVRDPDTPRLLATLPASMLPQSMSADGRKVAGTRITLKGSGEYEVEPGRNDVLVSDLTDPTRPTVVQAPCRTVAEPVLRPDGQVLTAVCADGQNESRLRSWRIENGELREVLSRPSEAGTSGARLRYGSTGRLLVFERYNRPGFQVLDMSVESAPVIWQDFRDHSRQMSEVAFGKDDHVLAVVTSQGIALWDISARDRPTRLADLQGFDGGRERLVYRADDDDFVGPMWNADGHIWRFPLNVARTRDALCARGNVELSDEEWPRYFPDIERVPVC